MTVGEGPMSKIMIGQKDIPVPSPMNVMMTGAGGGPVPDPQTETREDLDRVPKLKLLRTYIAVHVHSYLLFCVYPAVLVVAAFLQFDSYFCVLLS